MTKQAKKLIGPVAAAALASLVGLRAVAAPGGGEAVGLAATAASDDGEARAIEHYRKERGACRTVVQYGEQPTRIGPPNGDPEKDTYAYPVKRIGTVCGPAQP